MSLEQSPQPNISPPASPVNPASLTVAELARLLGTAGGKRVSAEQIQADIDAGAPVSAAGTINLIHYAAWLTRESGRENSENP